MSKAILWLCDGSVGEDVDDYEVISTPIAL